MSEHKSSINISMKNQGYYSWIHTLKSAAMEARQRGIQLNEEKARKITDPSKQAELAKGLEPIKPVEHGKPDVDPAAARAMAQVLAASGKTTPKTIQQAGGDVGAYVDLRRTKHAELLAQKARAQAPIDVEPSGDANAVELDAQDGVIEDPDMPQPNFGLAAQARVEAGNALPGDVERAQEYEAKQPVVSAAHHYQMLDDAEADEAAEEAYKAKQEYEYEIPTADWRAVRESVANKIKMLMNEKLDPVGQEDADVNNDGKTDGTDKYLAKRRKAIGKAIDKRKTKKS
jgi:hypothetical protein